MDDNCLAVMFTFPPLRAMCGGWSYAHSFLFSFVLGYAAAAQGPASLQCSRNGGVHQGPCRDMRCQRRLQDDQRDNIVRTAGIHH